MSRGQADFGAYAVKEVSASVSDMGEVAARLGSIVTYDKRGDVVDFDNFEEPVLKWRLSRTAGSTVILDNTNLRSGSQSVKLTPADAEDAYAGFYKSVPLIASTKLGFEVSFSYDADGIDLVILNDYYTGSYQYRPAVKIDLEAGKAYVLTTYPDTYTEVADFAPADVVFWFSTIKYVFDLATGYYKRLLLDNHEYDISSLAIGSREDTFPASLDINIKAYTRVATGANCWIDDFIFTQAEP